MEIVKKKHIHLLEINVKEYENDESTWYTRLWIIISNPFYYIFYGKFRY